MALSPFDWKINAPCNCNLWHSFRGKNVISRLHAEFFDVWWFNQANRISIELKSLSWLDYFVILNYLLLLFLLLLRISLDNFLKCYMLLSCYMVHTHIHLNFQADSVTLFSNTLWYNKESIVNYMIVLSASIHSQAMTFPHPFSIVAMKFYFSHVLFGLPQTYHLFPCQNNSIGHSSTQRTLFQKFWYYFWKICLATLGLVWFF